MSEAPSPPRNVLFVCSRNQWRSPTAEQLFRRHPGLSVRSAGTSAGARRRVSYDDLRWADVVLVMESKHASRLRAEFGAALGDLPIRVLEIPDEYGYMHPELVELLQTAVPAALDLP
jgi:predicted protein tyrosine phosphatase